MARIEMLSFSWIDGGNLPSIDTWFMPRALTSWSHRVIMGLVATANPVPPIGYTDHARFLSPKQYRASQRMVVEDGKLLPSLGFSDPGYTPPFNKSKLASFARDFVPINEDPNFYLREISPLSLTEIGKLCSSSCLAISAGYTVLASQIIKFRAGGQTDNTGITEANSPFHVPWVWCEEALIRKNELFRLLAIGSTFPSHAWYVNGKQVAVATQMPVTASDKDSAISTGQPAQQLQQPARADKSTGSADSHPFSIAKGTLVDVDISRYAR